MLDPMTRAQPKMITRRPWGWAGPWAEMQHKTRKIQPMLGASKASNRVS